MSDHNRIVMSNSDLGLVNHHHNEISSERTVTRRDKLANEVLGGALNDFFRAVCNRSFIQIGNSPFGLNYVKIRKRQMKIVRLTYLFDLFTLRTFVGDGFG